MTAEDTTYSPPSTWRGNSRGYSRKTLYLWGGVLGILGGLLVFCGRWLLGGVGEVLRGVPLGMPPVFGSMRYYELLFEVRLKESPLSIEHIRQVLFFEHSPLPSGNLRDNVGNEP